MSSRILHISDLHLTKDMGFNETYINKFYQIIHSNISHYGAIDSIFLTGDLREAKIDGASDVPSVNDVVSLIMKIANEVKVKKDDVHIVPGNHDYNRITTNETEENKENERIKKIKTDYLARNSGVFSHDALEKMESRFDDFFFSFCKSYYDNNPWRKKKSNPHTYIVKDDYDIIYLNTALTCMNRESDDGLLIGTKYIERLLENTEGKNVFILAHHPIQNINRVDYGNLKLIFSSQKNYYFWICGDVHKIDEDQIGDIKSYQIGSLTGASNTIPEFAIYNISKSSVIIDKYRDRQIYRYIKHLNGARGGWKHVHD